MVVEMSLPKCKQNGCFVNGCKRSQPPIVCLFTLFTIFTRFSKTVGLFIKNLLRMCIQRKNNS